MALARVEAEERGVTAVFADGARVTGELLIGADGGRSTVRTQFLPDVKPAYAGYVAWRGLVDEMSLSQQTRDALFEKFAFCLPPREQILGYPVAGQGNSTVPGVVVNCGGIVIPRSANSPTKYPLHPEATVAAPNAYSSTRSHPMIHATNSPSVAYP